MFTVKRYDVFGHLMSCVEVADAADIQYIDNDCIGDFVRGQHDARVDLLLPMSQLTIRTACGKLVVSKD